MKKVLVVFSLFTVFSILPASADHRNEDPLSYLASNASQLNYAVQNSWLRPQVKMAVSRFAHQIQRLQSCMIGDFGGRPFLNGISNENINNENLEKDHRLPGGDFSRCGYQVSKVFESFEFVERFLYDTSYDFPQIHELYRETRESLEQLRQL